MIFRINSSVFKIDALQIHLVRRFDIDACSKIVLQKESISIVHKQIPDCYFQNIIQTILICRSKLELFVEPHKLIGPKEKME